MNGPPDSNAPLYFRCHLCGDCCSSWNIPVEREKALQLLERLWVRARLAETRRELSPVSAELYRIPLTDANACVFLAEDGRCLVEVHEGLLLKPHECQRFPFATLRMPDGSARHETSAACKHISETLLLAFQPILPPPADSTQDVTGDAFAEWDAVGALPAQVRASHRKRLSIADYEASFIPLRAIFQDPARSPAAALKAAQALWLGRVTADSALASFPSRFPGPAWRAEMALLFFLRKPYRTWSALQLLRGGQYHDPRVFGVPVSLREQRRVRWDAASDRLLKAFLFNLLQRKRLLSQGSSLVALLGMAVTACLLVQWQAKTLAWLQQRAIVVPEDTAGAIRLVERYYTGHQPRFLRFFAAHWRGWLVQRLLLGR